MSSVLSALNLHHITKTQVSFTVGKLSGFYAQQNRHCYIQTANEIALRCLVAMKTTVAHMLALWNKRKQGFLLLKTKSDCRHSP